MSGYLEELKVMLLELADQKRYITMICDEVHVPPYTECVYILRRELEEAFDEHGILIKPLRIFHTSERPWRSIDFDLLERLPVHGFKVSTSHSMVGHPYLWIVPPKN